MNARVPRDETAAGLGYAALAYGSWGLFPLFWKQLVHVPALELVAHRVVWASLAYVLLLAWKSRLRELVAALADRRTLRVIVPTTLLIGSNWLVFIYAVLTDRVLHASLGYFLNPTVSIVLGLVFLRERMRLVQWLAVGIAAIGVVQLATMADGLPWISLVLSLTFGCYGLLRKLAPVDGLLGAAMESLLLLPIAIVYLVWLAAGGVSAFGDSGHDAALLVCAGVITAAPLVWFANAARRLALRTLGFMQYLAPTLQFALAVWMFGELVTPVHARAFACICGAGVLFTAEGWWWSRRATAQGST
jgi:chloramphenicol-sensitive protein RarD